MAEHEHMSLRDRVAEARKAEHASPQGFVAVTTNTVPGMEIVASHGVAMGSLPVVRSDVASMGLGPPTTTQALEKLTDQAKAVGGNGIIGLRIAVGTEFVVVYGTVVAA